LNTLAIGRLATKKNRTGARPYPWTDG